MPRQTEFERRIAAIEELVQALETATDPAARAAAQELVRALMDLHAAGLERMLELIRRNGNGGRAIVDQLAGDELVSSLLLLYDLHPVGLDTRIRGALEKTRPYLKSHGGNVELVAIEDSGVVRLRLEGSCHGCPASAMTLKLAIEQAIHEAAPEVTAIVVDGQNGSGPAEPATWQDLPELDQLPAGATRSLAVAGRELLVCRLEGNLYAYGARCPECEADLAAASLVGRALSCPGCGRSYDVVHAGRATDRPELHLDPFPLLTRNGRTQVALPEAAVAAAPL